VGAFVKFSTKQGDKVKLKVCSSFIDVAQARDNMVKEIPSWDMDEVIDKTKKIWDNQLNKIIVRGGSKEQKTIFYTSLYHAMLLPREFSEYGRYYSPFDGKIHQGIYYDDFSMWDTFRAEHPLLTILEPQRSMDMIKTLISMYEEGGWIPKWPNPYYSNDMIGTHSDSIITDAYLKGLRDFDINKAYEGMYKHATVEVTKEMWD
jgi:predicted alpha-1,2-mannosidase